MSDTKCEMAMSVDLLYNDINFEEIDDDLAAFQEDDMVQQALHRGVDLKKYGKELEKDLRQAENESVQEYVNNNQRVIDLHSEMLECDRVLARMEEMLHGFQADLGSISSEIKHLQEDSLSMSIKLKNRRAAEEKLNAFVERANISEVVINNILSSNVNDGFLDAVQLLTKRLYYFELEGPPTDDSSLQLLPSDTRCGIILYPELEKLRTKAIAKIRDYFATQFANLRKPKTNVQMLQQTALIKYAPLFQFAQKENPLVADDLRSMYVEAMGRTLTSLFKSYYSQLMKLEAIIATKTDLVAVEEQSLKSIFSQKVDMTKRSDTFSLGEREKVLEQIEREPILVHVATAEIQKYPYESILRSVLKHLVDAASNEFLFIIDFFKSNPKDTFNRIYGKTLSMLLEFIENYLVACYDAVGILLMIRMTYSFRLIMQRRRIPVLDPFFDRMSLLLWPRFKQIVDSNIKSIKTANFKKLGPVDLSPHYVSRRFAELVASISSLQGRSSITMNQSQIPSGPKEVELETGVSIPTDPLGIGGGGEHMVQQDIQLMRMEIIGLLERLASTLSNTKDQRVFFINNYDTILSIFQERHLLSDEVNKFESLIMMQKELFAEEEIKTFFPRLVAFVLQSEKQMCESGDGKAVLDDAMVEALVRDFAANWRSGIQQINDDVLAYFANFRNGMDILKQVLTQLLLYYSRFQDLIKRNYLKPPAFNRDIVSTATILLEIKRFSRTF